MAASEVNFPRSVGMGRLAEIWSLVNDLQRNENLPGDRSLQ